MLSLSAGQTLAMARTIAPLLPATLPAAAGSFASQADGQQVVDRAGGTTMTLRTLERGGAGVTMGTHLAVMHVLGNRKDLELLAHADPVGRELQDASLPARV